jgi:uncharacterized protein YdcH (DUF465 family)
MNDEEDWKEPFEDTGITLGPEEILRREIEKSKNLKVERLQLKDEIEKLRAENTHLTQKNQALTEEIKTAQADSRKAATPLQPQPFPGPSQRWSLFLLIFNSCALAILLYFLLQK